MMISVYKHKCPNSGRKKNEICLKFPTQTKVISLDPTIQILFITKEDLRNWKKIDELCRPWNYVRKVVFEEGLWNYPVHYNQIYVDDCRLFYSGLTFNINPLYFEEPSLKRNKDIEFLKNNIPPGILPYYEFRKNNNWIYGSFRKKGWLDVWIWEDKVWLRYYRRFKEGNVLKGYYTYTYNNIQEAIPEIKKIIGEMGYV